MVAPPTYIITSVYNICGGGNQIPLPCLLYTSQQTKTHEAAAGYSPRLCNDDLAPTRDQNWSWYNIFSFWMSDVHSMGDVYKRQVNNCEEN